MTGKGGEEVLCASDRFGSRGLSGRWSRGHAQSSASAVSPRPGTVSELLQTELFAELGKVHTSIELIRMFAPRNGDQYYLAFSGGKDSVVLYDLAVRSGVRFRPFYCITTVDPPELIYFMRANYPGLAWHRPPRSMYKLIEDKGLPSRTRRWCCELLKEKFPQKGFILTGIRSEESPRRRHERRPVERCRYHPLKTYVHPLKDWSEAEVWQYLKARGLPYCVLYDRGWRRIGCVICPFERHPERSMRDYPRIWQAARRAFEKYWEDTNGKLKQKGVTSQDVWQWWVDRDRKLREESDCGGLFV